MNLVSSRTSTALQGLCGLFYTLMFIMAAVEGQLMLKLCFLGLLMLSAGCAVGHAALRPRHAAWSSRLAGLPVIVLATVVLAAIPQHYFGR